MSGLGKFRKRQIYVLFIVLAVFSILDIHSTWLNFKEDTEMYVESNMLLNHLGIEDNFFFLFLYKFVLLSIIFVIYMYFSNRLEKKRYEFSTKIYSTNKKANESLLSVLVVATLLASLQNYSILLFDLQLFSVAGFYITITTLFTSLVVFS